jgi:hyperosmotically inducible protein
MKQTISKTLMAAALLFAPIVTQAATPDAKVQTLSSLENEVRHELVMLPWYGVFDNLSFQVDNQGVVTLSGEVNRPTLKSGAENVVKKIEGVTAVKNNIEVLPLSPFDDRVRWSVARAIYGFNGPLYRYAMSSQPSIRIIVKNGNVTLTGVVANEFDKNVANVRANQVSGVFSVTNNLIVSKS